MRQWEKQTQAEVFQGIQRPTPHDRQIYTLSAEGKVGRNYECSNAHTIDAGFHYNGSGDGAFGGAKQWPHVTLKVSFQEGQIKERDVFVRNLQRWLETNLPS